MAGDDDDEAPDAELIQEGEEREQTPEANYDPYPFAETPDQKFRCWLWELHKEGERNGAPQDTVKAIRDRDMEFDWLKSRAVPPQPVESKISRLK